MSLKNKKILLGITGSIAAYKACLVLRRLQSSGAEVRVMMTESAQKFIGRLTLETLTSHSVIIELFPEDRMITTEHIHLAEWADVILICPATANCIGKVASGIADDFMTTTIMASRAPVIFAPAMDTQMFENPIIKKKPSIKFTRIINKPQASPNKNSNIPLVIIVNIMVDFF